MKRLFAFVPFVVALPIVVYSAVWQGNLTERWGTFPELAVCAKRIDNIPLEVGGWKGMIGQKLDEATRQYAGAVGDTSIVYTNSKTGERVSVFVVCGRLDDVMKHRPDRCYPAHGYKEEGERMQRKVTTESGAKAEFQTATYSREGLPAPARLYWAWSSDGNWLAPDDLRDDFYRDKPVFKVHFEHELTQANQSIDEGPSVELIKVLVPELSRALFPDYKPPAKSPEKSAKG
ncbi:MAG TPA: exosortase-associated EpsI family protein [Pirellulales bacterium]|jgi:hypothetical protein|nr:exosortase-associated EpsI family protein [Pirellulales bacterium]